MEYQEKIKSLNETIERQTIEINDLNKCNGESKHDLETKNTQITNYLIEIKDLNHQTNQLRQNISELESKKIELMAQLHNKSGSEDNGDTNHEQSNQILNLIKVIYLNKIIMHLYYQK